MEWYVIGGLLLFFLGREVVTGLQKKSLKKELRTTLNKLGKEKLKNVQKKYKKTKSNYHDLRDAYGRFRKSNGRK